MDCKRSSLLFVFSCFDGETMSVHRRHGVYSAEQGCPSKSQARHCRDSGHCPYNLKKLDNDSESVKFDGQNHYSRFLCLSIC